ncbi:TPA: recombinase family protein, partial [Enterobacter cloacae]|nr:recombinase family protein [Enterobacter cloacae]
MQHWLDNHAGFTLVEEYSDEGLSAFSGAQLAPGSDLSRQLEVCKRGLYQPGAVLLVGAFDLLSRGGIDATQQLVRDILLTDMRIVILQDNPDKFYDRSALDDAFAVITIAIKAQAAHEESEKKQKRGLINWSQKRLQAAQGKIMTPLVSCVTLRRASKKLLRRFTTSSRSTRLLLDGLRAEHRPKTI